MRGYILEVNYEGLREIAHIFICHFVDLKLGVEILCEREGATE